MAKITCMQSSGQRPLPQQGFELHHCDCAQNRRLRLTFTYLWPYTDLTLSKNMFLIIICYAPSPVPAFFDWVSPILIGNLRMEVHQKEKKKISLLQKLVGLGISTSRRLEVFKENERTKWMSESVQVQASAERWGRWEDNFIDQGSSCNCEISWEGEGGQIFVWTDQSMQWGDGWRK